MKKPTYAILGASPFTGNKGVNALLSGTLESITHAGADAVIIDYSKTKQTPSSYFIQYKCLKQFIPLRFTWKLHVPNSILKLIIKIIASRILFSKKRRVSLFKNDPWLSPIYATDTGVAISGGDSFSDIYGFRRLVYVCLPQLLLLSLGKNLIILPQTIGPFKSKWAKALATYILRRSKQVFARDQESVKAANNLIGKKGPRTILSRDMAFALRAKEPINYKKFEKSKTEDSRIRVAVNVSGLLLMGGYSRKNMFGLSCDYPKLIQDLVTWLIKEENCRVLLISHVTSGAENDQDAAQHIYDSLSSEFHDKLRVIDPHLTDAEIKYVIGQSSFLFGSRMHACIAALSQGIPAIGLAYSRKFRGLYKTLNAESLILDLSQHSNESILNECRSLFKDRLKHQEQLAPQAMLAKKQALNLFSSLSGDETSRIATATA